VLDREKRPTVDNRGVIAAVGQLANASQLPMADGRAFAAPDEAIANVGAAIARTGSLLGALAEKRQEAQDDIVDAKTEGDLKMLYAEHVKSRDPADPSTWDADIATRLDAFKGKMLDQPGMSPSAKQRVLLRYTRFDGDARSDVLKESSKALFGMAAGAEMARSEQAIQAQNPEDYAASRQTLATKGYAHPFQLQKLDERYKAVGEVKKKELKQTLLDRADLFLDTGDTESALKQIDIIKEQNLAEPEVVETLRTSAMRRGEMVDWERRIDLDPLKAREALGTMLDEKGKTTAGTKLTPEQVMKLENHAAVSVNLRRTTLFGEAVEMIKGGRLLSDKEISEYGQGTFRPLDVERLTNARRNVAGPDPTERTALVADISAYDASKDVTKEKLADLNTRIHLVPDGFKEMFRNQLNGQLKPDGAVAKEMAKIIGLRLEMGAYGDVTQKKGKPVKPEDYRAAHEKAADLQYNFSEWLKEHPKATATESKQWLIDQTQSDARGAALKARGWFGQRWDILGSTAKPGLEADVKKTAARADAIIAKHRSAHPAPAPAPKTVKTRAEAEALTELPEGDGTPDESPDALGLPNLYDYTPTKKK
jgi:hypothetical protein